MQKDADERLLEARKLAGMGFSVEEIEEELKRIKMVSAVLSYSFLKGFFQPCPVLLVADWQVSSSHDSSLAG